MLEIVNKKHSDINSNNREKTNSFITIKSKEIYFSAATCRGLGLSEKLFIHFVIDDDVIYFYANTDKDGFRLINRPRKNSLIVLDVSLIKYILARKPFTLPASFPIKISDGKLKGSALVEILFNKPILNPIYPRNKNSKTNY